MAIFFAFTFFQERNLLTNEQSAPYFNLKILGSNERLTLAELKGKKTVIYFFAPWCSICKMSMPNVNTLYENGEINAIAIAADFNNEQEVEDFTADLAITMPVVLAQKYTTRHYKISAYPTYYIISEDLKVTSQSMGYSTELGIRARTF
jgi:thiol-disulfide isomerase/thioredoxin